MSPAFICLDNIVFVLDIIAFAKPQILKLVCELRIKSTLLHPTCP